jgi:glucokinase
MRAEPILAGVDIGGTKTAVVLSSSPPAILKRIEFPTLPAEGPDPCIQKIVAALRSLLSERNMTPAQLGAIGVSCGGPLDPVTGVIQSPPNLWTWDNVPIRSILEKEFGVECLLENDANAGALAEYWFGAGRGAQSIVFITMGTGFGSGLILDGRLYRGVSNLAGEIGHVRLTETGPRAFGKTGCAEAWASGAGMANAGREAVRSATVNGESTMLANLDTLTAREIWQAARQNDAVAQRIVRSTGERLGEACAIFADLINPDRIIVGGLALRMGDALLEPARLVMQREALPGAAAVCTIVPAALGERIGDVAALCVALDRGVNLPAAWRRDLLAASAVQPAS